MSIQGGLNGAGFLGGCQAGEAKKQYPRVNQSLAEYQLAKIFIRSYEKRIRLAASRKHRFVRDASLQFGYLGYFVVPRLEVVRRFARRHFHPRRSSPLNVFEGVNHLKPGAPQRRTRSPRE